MSQSNEIRLNSTASAEDIRCSISQAVNADKVVLFTKENCSYCKEAKELFNSTNRSYSVIDLDQYQNAGDILGVLGELTGAKTVPRVFINGSCVGGFADTKKLQSAGSLDAMLKN